MGLFSFCVDFGVCVCTVWLFFCVERRSWSVSQTGRGLLILPSIFFLLLPLQLNCMVWTSSFFHNFSRALCKY